MKLNSLINSFEQVFIDERALGSAVATRTLELFPSDRVKIVSERPFQRSDGKLSADEYDRSKKNLYLTEFKGTFFKRCPGAKPGLSCCNYFVLNLGQQCNMNCSYCYLQSYINSPVLTIYTNIETALAEIKNIALEHPNHFYRVGTGEVTDSLSLDGLTHYARTLVRFFRDFPQWQLELKTKSNIIEHFVDEPHRNNVIVSWSINPNYVIENEEHGTASLTARLEAARSCRDHGFKVAFHIDPMIYFHDWKTHYGDLIHEITSQFRPQEIAWITVGALRFDPDQRHLMRERFGYRSLITSAEVFPSEEGKLKYDRELRNEMFQFVVSSFKNNSPSWKVSLCMETKESWVMTMASSPRQIPEISALFGSQRVVSTTEKTTNI